MVTSDSMRENKIGNRGSKSIIIIYYLIIVKEQRVDGSYLGLNLI